MVRIDYGQAEAIDNPDFSNASVVSQKFIKKHCTDLKYIDNSNLNSDNSGYAGFALVGKHTKTENWRIIKVWRYW